ncbi:hypothetical protein PAXRUDRAFT_23017 [Paxillus rubicundulus Ve08.2h10]|uniref:Arrestin-like N-terminal domain-containing protein n=1 Tax=Paxillus rubicundulus Ve08.2h10 TaxID=930991 RepID=A0A0D0EDD8_9AGAM|nr:hypothetical protein PAXRUDRAFT_23017 [Paxillus rubicundulus Ve08.2h10]
MAPSLDIQPFSSFLDMYGDADSSFPRVRASWVWDNRSAFSLAGYISVSLISPTPMFKRQRAITRLLLQSLTITFEGQSETLTPRTGYAPVRLCSVTRELLCGEPVDLSNEGREDSDEPCSWNVVFDIPVPGWLPTTSVYGDTSVGAAGTRYALYATATFTSLDEGNSSPFSFTNFCAPFRSRARTADAPTCPITLRRFVEPPTGSSSSAFPMSLYIVDAQREPETEGSAQSSIPPDVLKKIHVIASIPSAVTMNESSLPFVLRLQGKDLDSSECERLRITQFSVDVEQVEVYRNTLSRDHLHRYPILSQRHQPPNVPLRNPHPIHTLCDTALFMTAEPSKASVDRQFSLLPPSESGLYIVSGDGRVFMHGSSTAPDEKWYILETKVPIAMEPHLADWAGAQKRRTTEISPLFSVQHFVHVAIRCEYDLPDSEETVHERLHFSLPLKHVCIPEFVTPSEDAIKRKPSVELQKSCPYAQTLPAYSQLFHPNGERKIDYTIPLPVYEPPLAAE